MGSPNNMRRLNDMTVYQMFREQLAALEKNIFDNRRAAAISKPHNGKYQKNLKIVVLLLHALFYFP